MMTMATMADGERIQELFERAKGGDRDAFEELVLRSQGKLEPFIERRLRPDLRRRLDVAALANDTFARAFESFGRFAGRDEDSWFAWLSGIAKMVVLKEIERLKRSRAVGKGREITIDAPSPSRALRREERFERLKTALEGLSGDHREVIRLCRIEGLPIREVARTMNRTAAAVKMLLCRALKELKGKFGDTESLGLPQRTFESEGGRDGR